MVFDTAGNFIKAWGGDGAGYEWPQREHGIHIDNKGFVWITRQQLPDQRHRGPQACRRRPDLEVHAGRQVRHADRPQQPEQGQRRHAERPPRGRRAGATRAPTSCSSPTATAITASRYSMPTAASSSGCGAPSATSPLMTTTAKSSRRKASRRATARRTSASCTPCAIAKDGMVYVADRENRRVQAFTTDGKFVKQLVKTDTPFARDLALSPDPSAAVSVCRQRRRYRHRRSCDAADRRQHQGAGHDRRRPPHRDRFERQYLHRAERRWGCRS